MHTRRHKQSKRNKRRTGRKRRAQIGGHEFETVSMEKANNIHKKFKDNFFKYYELKKNWRGKEYYKLRKERENTNRAILEGIVNPNINPNINPLFSKKEIELLKKYIERMKEDIPVLIQQKISEILQLPLNVNNKVVIELTRVQNNVIQNYIKEQIYIDKLLNNENIIITNNEYNKLPYTNRVNNSQDEYIKLDKKRYISKDLPNNGSENFSNPFSGFNFNHENSSESQTHLDPRIKKII